MSVKEFKKRLLLSPVINLCSDQTEARRILQSEFAWGDLETIYIFSETYQINVCVHIHNSSDHDNKRVHYCHYRSNSSPDFIHLKLRDIHYTPLLPTGEEKPENFDNDLRVNDPNESIKNSNDTDFPTQNLMDYTDYSEESPEYIREPDDIPPKPPDGSAENFSVQNVPPELSFPQDNQEHNAISLNK